MMGGNEISFYKEWVFFWGVLGVSKFLCSSASMVSSGSVVRPVLEGWSLRVWSSLGYLWGFRSEDVLGVEFCSVALLVWFPF
jgi:hypothetical protein